MNKLFGYIVAGIGAVVAFCGGIVLIGLLISYPTMWLWNACLVGVVAGILPITSVWKAFGLLILCALLFKFPVSNLSSKK